MIEPRSAPMRPKHEPGTDGARDLETDDLLQASLAVDQGIAARGIIAFDGPVGTGKTFALKSIIEDLDLPYWYLPIGPDSTGKGFESALLEAIYASEEPPRGVDRSRLRSDLRWDLYAALSATPCVLFLDDFDTSGVAGTKVIRWLYEQGGLQATFVIVGNDLGPMFRRVPAFDSRVMRWIPFGRIPADEIVERMRAYHPLFEASDDELLQRVDARHAHGNLRAWAIFLAAARAAAIEAGVVRLTEAVVDAAFLAINAGRRAGDGQR